jgi:hemerythrin-like domain-containing protein
MVHASQDLMNEHEGILFGLQILEEMTSCIRQRQPSEIGDLREIVHFFRLFADKCHHGKEEGLYFPELEKYGVRNEGGLIGQLLLEHAEGRKYIAIMDQAAASLLDPESFAGAAENYIKLLRTHIGKENTGLFPMGDRMIPADRQASLLEAFEDFELNVMGAGTHEQLHLMLDRFEDKYLK